MRLRIWTRNVHVYASLAMCVLFLFFGMTGFMANRSELYGAKTEQTLPANVTLEQKELVGYMKSHLPEAAVFRESSEEDGIITMEFENGAAGTVAVEVTTEDRMFSITEHRPLPKSADTLDDVAMARLIAAPLSGHMDEDAIESDEESIYFSVESVWREVVVEVNKADATYRITATKAPWVTALTNLHRGKNASPLQKVFIDVCGLVMVLAVLTGMLLALRSRLKRTRIIATLLNRFCQYDLLAQIAEQPLETVDSGSPSGATLFGAAIATHPFPPHVAGTARDTARGITGAVVASQSGVVANVRARTVTDTVTVGAVRISVTVIV